MTKLVYDDARDGWPAVLTYWRSLPAERFDHRLQNEVDSCVRSVMTTVTDLRSAIQGDAATACSLALGMAIPARIGPHVDFVMTTLLNCAFVNPAAALVLSNRLEQMPLPWRNRTRLSTSWKVHNIYLARRSFGRHSIPVTLLRRDNE